MKEHPILFTGDMVNAILTCRKTQTRRVIKPQPKPHHWSHFLSYILQCLHLKDGPHYRFRHSFSEKDGQRENSEWDGNVITCPFGVPGDRLWVRETHSFSEHFKGRSDDQTKVWYRAANDRPTWAEKKWRPSIHMPRFVCRLLLEVTSVRVERVHDITEKDARLEGCDFDDDIEPPEGYSEEDRPTAKLDFEFLWNSINSKRGFGWESNPWVWVVEFKLISETSDA